MPINSKLDAIVKSAGSLGVSDVHIMQTGDVYFRKGEVLEKDYSVPLEKTDVMSIASSIMDDNARVELKKDGRANLAIDCDGWRLRTHIYRQRGTFCIVIRLIPSEVPSALKLGLPGTVKDFALRPRGIVLVAGPGRSGKSTTVAALVNEINNHEKKHILTVEDPVEFVYEDKLSIITQRQVGVHTPSFASGLKHALRQDPDVIVIGEMKDLETMSTAITTAETGHLVISTVHTTGAAQTIDRIINVFPIHQQEQIRAQLSLNLQGVVSQILLPTKDGKSRIAAFEVLYPTHALRNMIRKGETSKMQNALDTSAKAGCRSMRASIVQLEKKGKISKETSEEAIAMTSWS